MNSESIGFLQVIAKTANGALPVENAQINIYEYTPSSEGGERGRIIYTLYTDQDGRAPKVALNTKNKELSLTPGNENPFSVYNIEASREGFYSNSYINVPIFQGITAIQPVELIPLIEYASQVDDFPSSTRRFVETPNTAL
ncbi:MAG: hypothetical protein E7596_00975 [Ruminococcaceae bacterium]|nr:hypothetical protein [Oscillospiraceae bacterium]